MLYGSGSELAVGADAGREDEANEDLNKAA
jgi:hypothetical protein